MKKALTRHIPDILILSGFAIMLVVGRRTGFFPSRTTEGHFLLFLKDMLGFLPCIFILVGLADVWFPEEQVRRAVGAGSGWSGTGWVILLGMFQAGPLMGAFPVAALLLKKGVSRMNLFVYLGSFSTLKVPMLTFETGFLGLKFMLLRTMLSLPVFLLIAFAMDKLLKNRPLDENLPSG
jgi:uncharacterized membrane protein YraQ (UPF0718 family)